MDGTGTATTYGCTFDVTGQAATFEKPSSSELSPSTLLRGEITANIPEAINTPSGGSMKIANGTAVLSFTYIMDVQSEGAVSGLIISCAGRIILNSYYSASTYRKNRNPPFFN